MIIDKYAQYLLNPEGVTISIFMSLPYSERQCSASMDEIIYQHFLMVNKIPAAENIRWIAAESPE